MLHLKRIWLFGLLLLPFGALASHILGGQVRYMHLSGQRYQFVVEVYRDCMGCKLNGNGGGSSKDNCDDISRLFITANNSSLNLALVTLTRTAIQDISPVCSEVLNACSNPVGTMGIEKHVFTGIFNFGTLSTDSRCSFDVHLQIASRSNELTNGMASDKFHTTAHLNLCSGIANNSPEFFDNPTFQFHKDQSYNLSLAATDKDGDSLVYRWVRPLIDFGVEGNYASGFGPAYPISAYCPFTGSCQPYPENNPPVGFFLSGLNARWVFMPTRASEHSVLCLEVQEYRRVNGQTVLIGSTRRDVQISVLQSTVNTAPEIKNSQQYQVCPDSMWCMDFDLKDDAYNSGSKMVQDTLQLKVRFEHPEGSLSTKVINEAPFKEYTFCYSPNASDTFKRFHLYADLSDQFCPRPLKTQKLFQIEVLPAPKASIDVQNLPCNLFALSFSGNTPMDEIMWRVYRQDNNQLMYEKHNEKDSFLLQYRGTYRIELSLNNGACSRVIERLLEVDQDLTSVISIQGNRTLCLGDTLKLNAIPSAGYEVLQYRWFRDGIETGNASILNTIPGDNALYHLSARVRQNGIECYSADTHSVNVLIPQKPEIAWTNSLCAGTSSVDLSQLEPVAGGVWSHLPDGFVLGNMLYVPENLVRDQEHTLFYTITDQQGCRATASHTYHVLAPEQFSMMDLSVCGGMGLMTLNPFLEGTGKAASEVNWDLSTVGSHARLLSGVMVLDLDSLTSGSYSLSAWYRDARTCLVRDTSILILQPSLSISHREIIPVVCAPGIQVDLFQLTGVRPLGGVFISDHPEDQISQQGVLVAADCGQRNILYAYDRFNCHDQILLPIEVLCQPEFEIGPENLNVCDQLGSLALEAKPSGGVWNGEGVSASGIFEISEVQRPESRALSYSVSMHGCVFQKEVLVTIYPSPAFSVIGLKEEWCEGETIDLNITGSRVEGLKLHSGIGILDTIFLTQPGASSSNWTWNKLLNREFTQVKHLSFEPIHDLNCPNLTVGYPINIHALPILEPQSPAEGCHPFETSLNARLLNYKESDAIFTWNFGDGSHVQSSERSRQTHVWEQHGTYDVLLNVALTNGCSNEFNYPQLITVHETPRADFTSSPDDYVSNSDPVFSFYDRSQSERPLTYYWDFGVPSLPGISSMRNPVFRFPSDTATYEVLLKVTGDGGCSDIASRLLTIGPDIRLFIPNAFSPHPEGPTQNNTFGVQGQNVASVQIEVFDRWGMKVFHGNDIKARWDGSSKGIRCLPGVYSYVIRAVTLTGNEYQYSGTLHLLR